MSAYTLGKLAAVPDPAAVAPAVADPGTYWGRFKNMIRGSKVAPYALGGGLALGALYGLPKLYDKLTAPGAPQQFAEPMPGTQQAPIDERSHQMLAEILARTSRPAPEREQVYTNDPASDSYWKQVMAVSALKRNRDQQMLGGLTGERQ